MFYKDKLRMELSARKVNTNTPNTVNLVANPSNIPKNNNYKLKNNSTRIISFTKRANTFNNNTGEGDNYFNIDTVIEEMGTNNQVNTESNINERPWVGEKLSSRRMVSSSCDAFNPHTPHKETINTTFNNTMTNNILLTDQGQGQGQVGSKRPKNRRNISAFESSYMNNSSQGERYITNSRKNQGQITRTKRPINVNKFITRDKKSSSPNPKPNNQNNTSEKIIQHNNFQNIYNLNINPLKGNNNQSIGKDNISNIN
jgi:hypothetical protein